MGIWNEKSVREEALKYSRKSDFHKCSSGAYWYAWKHNLLKDYDWFITEDNIKRCIYVYIDEENKYAYVGVTSNKEQRHIAHKTGMFNKHVRDNSPVYKHFTFIGKEVPDPIYLEDDIMGSVLAQEREDYWKKKYEEMGYKMLNLGPTGAGKGSLGIGKWNDENIMEEAKKYKTKTEFYKGNRGAHDYAKRHNMLNELFENVRVYWTDETVREEAKKYKTRAEFLKVKPGAYDYAYNHHMLDELFDKPFYWTADLVREEAKKYKSKKEFLKCCPGGHQYAYNHNMLDELFGKTFYWSADLVREEAKKYKSRTEFHKESGSAYMYAQKHHMLDELFDSLVKYVDVNEVRDKAAMCDSRREFKKIYKSLYEYAVRHHMLDELFPKK